jgi:hypothetical protein
MATRPFVIKDYINPVENPRVELMKETDLQIQGRKGFIFKGFVTEKERIVINKNNIILYRSNI